MEQYKDILVISFMNILVGIIAIAVVIFILGIGTLLSGKQPNTTCSGEDSCSVCGGDAEKCENT